MNISEYQALAMKTRNPELDSRDMLINAAMGLSGESGEAIEIVKKWLFHGHDLDRERLIRELGDIAWYLAEAAEAIDVPLEEILCANIEKLKRRYPEGFDAERSMHRRDGE